MKVSPAKHVLSEALKVPREKRHIVPLKQIEHGVYGDAIMRLGNSIFYRLTVGL